MPARRSPVMLSRRRSSKPTTPAQKAGRRTGPDSVARPHPSSGASSVVTDYPLWCMDTGERCAAPNAASGRPASSTRADLDRRPPIRRRRECAACSMRFTTYERVEAARLVVIKRKTGPREFDRERLASGLRKALTRRPVPDGALKQPARREAEELRGPASPRCAVVADRCTCHGAASGASTRSPDIRRTSPACTRASRISRRSSARSTASMQSGATRSSSMCAATALAPRRAGDRRVTACPIATSARRWRTHRPHRPV